MAKLRVFISSTCYDLDVLRSELRPFIQALGYEPIMSEYSDVLFDPRSHTHDSCLKEVPGCDMVVLIIGSRFGGTAVPSALASLDFGALERISTKTEILQNKERLSITQLEVLKAIEQLVPVYAFVEERVLHDQHLYERNKDNAAIIDKIEFPSIQKRETAKYVFEFINFLTHRTTNNSITGFNRLDDIRAHLLGQWSQMFQRLLLESRTKTQEALRYRDFSERIDDLKAVVLASLATPDLRATAKGAVQYRQLVSFVSELKFIDQRSTLLSHEDWASVLRSAGIVEIREDNDRRNRSRAFLIRKDRTFYISVLPVQYFDMLAREWAGFQRLAERTREAIVDALLGDAVEHDYNMLRYVEIPIEVHLRQRADGDDSQKRVSELDR